MSSAARSSDESESGRRRRILYLITSDISGRFLSGQLAYLIEHGYEVHVGVRLSDPPARFDDGVTAHDLPFEREPSPRRDALALWRTIQLVRELRPDIVNASTPKAGLLGMLASTVCRVPQRVYVVRGLRFETLTGQRRRAFRLLERLATACATDLVYNSRSLMEAAEDERVVRRGRGVVLGPGSGNGIDASRFDELPTRRHAREQLGIDQDARVIGFVGRLTRDKGVVDLVDAWKESLHGSVLLLVGDFEDGDPLPETTRSAIESGSGIIHVPWMDDTRHVYRAMDVLAFPSYREGLPNVPLEAQLCGVPVVAYAATGTVDVFSDAHRSTLIPVGDVAALRASITSTLCRPREHRADLEDASGWVRETFRPDFTWSNLLALYQK